MDNEALEWLERLIKQIQYLKKSHELLEKTHATLYIDGEIPKSLEYKIADHLNKQGEG